MVFIQLRQYFLYGDILFKNINKYGILDVDDLPQNFLITESLINLECLENETKEIVLSI